MLDLPLQEMIAELVNNIDAGRMKATLEIFGSPRILTAQSRLTFYRSTQEALNNSVKHSQATKVSVIINYESPDEVVMTINDNGLGTDQMDGGFGLIGIKERVHLLNGDVQFISAKGQGFAVEIRLPG